MNNFTFYSPTEFVFGKDTEQKVGNLCKKYGATKVLIVYGGGSAKRSGLIDRVINSLNDEGIDNICLSGVKPNPTEELVYKGIDLARRIDVDFVLAVGGGSVIDTAKSIAGGVPYDGDFWDFYVHRAEMLSALPVATVLTIPAAGSEGSGNAVITNTRTKQKLGIHQPMLLRPKFSIMNPELTMTLPAWQTASGICDMMAHILERYLTNTPNVFISDRLAEGALMAIMDAATIVMSEPDNYDARANIMWSGMIAHNDTCSAGRVEDWSSHALEHEISAIYDVTHGAGLAVIFPAFLEYAAKKNPHKIQQLAQRVFGCDDPFEGINKMKTFFHDTLKLPVNFHELGIDNPDIDTMVKQVHKNKGAVFGGYIKLTPDDSRAIYEIANSAPNTEGE